MKKTLLDDENLVELFKKTKENSYFQEIFVRFKQRTYLLAVKLLRQETWAEDLTHEVFTKIFETIDTYPGGNFYGWVVRLTQEAYIAKIRSLRKEAVAHPEMSHSHPDELMMINGKEYSPGELNLVGQDVMWQMEELGPEQKACFLLKYMDGRDDSEIAVMTGYTVKQVKIGLRNGRRKCVVHWRQMEKRRKP